MEERREETEKNSVREEGRVGDRERQEEALRRETEKRAQNRILFIMRLRSTY